MRYAVASLLLLLILACCQLQPQSTPPTPPPASGWTLYPSASASFTPLRALDDRYLWMASGWGGSILQYDIQSDRLTTFTDVDGLPLSRRNIISLRTSGDGRCILGVEWDRAVFVWSPQKSWRRLPLPANGLDVADVGFDSGDNPLVLFRPANNSRTCTFFTWINHEWTKKFKTPIPGASDFIPVAGGFLVRGYDKSTAFYWVSSSDPAAPRRLPGLVPDLNRVEYVRLGDRVFLLAPERVKDPAAPAFPYVRAITTLREVVPGGLTLTPQSAPQYLDLPSRSFRPFALAFTPGQRAVCTFDPSTAWEGSIDNAYHLVPVRDLHGNLWCAGQRFAQGQWQSPSGTRHDALGLRVIDQTQFHFDAAADAFKRNVPQSYGEHFSAWDAPHRTAWVGKTFDSPVIDFIDFSSSPPRILRTVRRPPGCGWPQILDARGNWWCFPAVRLSPDGNFRSYPVETQHLWMNPKSGDIWARSHPGDLKFDPATDAFVPTPAIPWDDLSFRIGRYQLARRPRSDGNESLMIKTPDRWQTWDLPTSDHFGVRSTEDGRLNDRLLVSTVHGVWEYNGHTDRWVRLYSWGARHVAFDTAGRRLIAGGPSVLAYTGDPFLDSHATITPELETSPSLFELTYPDCPLE